MIPRPAFPEPFDRFGGNRTGSAASSDDQPFFDPGCDIAGELMRPSCEVTPSRPRRVLAKPGSAAIGWWNGRPRPARRQTLRTHRKQRSTEEENPSASRTSLVRISVRPNVCQPVDMNQIRRNVPATRPILSSRLSCPLAIRHRSRTKCRRGRDGRAPP
jgi:hypothetical protein